MYWVFLPQTTSLVDMLLPQRLHVLGMGRPNLRRTCHPSFLHFWPFSKLSLLLRTILGIGWRYILQTKLRIWAFSLSLDRRSRWVAMFWWFWAESYSSRRRDGSPISMGIMASTPYTRLNGDSFVVDWGLHVYAHNTSTSSSGHRPLALFNRLRSSTSITLFAASACPLVCGCSTKLVTCLMPRSV